MQPRASTLAMRGSWCDARVSTYSDKRALLELALRPLSIRVIQAALPASGVVLRRALAFLAQRCEIVQENLCGLFIGRGDRHELQHVVFRLGRDVERGIAPVAFFERGEAEHPVLEAEFGGRFSIHLVWSLC